MDPEGTEQLHALGMGRGGLVWVLFLGRGGVWLEAVGSSVVVAVMAGGFWEVEVGGWRGDGGGDGDGHEDRGGGWGWGWGWGMGSRMAWLQVGCVDLNIQMRLSQKRGKSGEEDTERREGEAAMRRWRREIGL